METNISVIIIDDHPIVLQGFTYVLQDIAYIQLLGTFITASDGLEFLAQQAVDVVLLDINMPDMNGIHACQEIVRRHPASKVLAISNNNEASIIQRMLQSGAAGYILKNAATEELLACIKSAMRGETALSTTIQEIRKNTETGELPMVTRREKEVLHLLAQGLTTPEIAEKIFVSPLTVESHRRNLLQKFRVTNSASLVHKATELRYI
ncbi:response regulator transcription factor [Rhabdobacter roseus]|uniref:DNA-binding NarL/FixJ family response regulator n=1 Tax=Rhabdobacter roseus TaxID=1655419 RepID=A0A840TRC7_9BACT|nr:response regulator transcription factor [Rhabdobacter roseus]MBB5286451.1 DNA-binding NarL/FixJ family response regulator [Rhabdobacter roseus]